LGEAREGRTIIAKGKKTGGAGRDVTGGTDVKYGSRFCKEQVTMWGLVLVRRERQTSSKETRHGGRKANWGREESERVEKNQNLTL